MYDEHNLSLSLHKAFADGIKTWVVPMLSEVDFETSSCICSRRAHLNLLLLSRLAGDEKKVQNDLGSDSKQSSCI